MLKKKSSEIIFNKDLSIYHLGLNTEDFADNIILVGDPKRVSFVSKYFDKIEIQKSKREFTTNTGYTGKKRISVISSGIGVDNVDIVINELNILNSKKSGFENTKRKLNFIKLGTCGSISKKIDVNEIIFSKYCIGSEGIIYYYNFDNSILEKKLIDKFIHFTKWDSKLALPYAIKASEKLWKSLYSNNFRKGITLTTNSFYGGQGREFNIKLQHKNIIKNLSDLTYKKLKVLNFEMESSGIYSLSKIFNHNAISINVVLANRVTNKFSNCPDKAVDNMIKSILGEIEKI